MSDIEKRPKRTTRARESTPVPASTQIAAAAASTAPSTALAELQRPPTPTDKAERIKQLLERPIEEGYTAEEELLLMEVPQPVLEKKFIVNDNVDLPLKFVRPHPLNGRPMLEPNVQYWMYVCVSVCLRLSRFFRVF